MGALLGEGSMGALLGEGSMGALLGEGSMATLLGELLGELLHTRGVERPKSPSRMSARSVSKMFSGLMSRWSTPAACTAPRWHT
jgi:hypothetical protein